MAPPRRPGCTRSAPPPPSGRGGGGEAALALALAAEACPSAPPAPAAGGGGGGGGGRGGDGDDAREGAGAGPGAGAGAPPRGEGPPAAAGASEDLSFREILRFSVPAFGAIICDPVMGFVDTAVVGQVSTLELAALGPNMVIWGAAVFLLNCFVTTTTSRVARAHLAGRADAARRVISDAVWLSAACGAALGAAMYALRSQVFALFGLVGAVAAPARAYYDIRVLSMPGTIMCLALAASCMGRKDSRTPLLVSLFAGLFNLVGDLWCVLGPWRMGAGGASAATCLSIYVAAGAYLWHLHRTVGLDLRVPTWARVRPFVQASGAVVVRNFCIMANFVLVSCAATSLGVVVAAAHQVAASVFNVAQYVGEPLSSCAQAYLPAAASSLRRTPEERRFLDCGSRRLAAAGAAAGAVVVAAVAAVLGRPEALTVDPAVASSVLAAVPAVCLCALLACLSCVTDGLLLAASDLKFLMASSALNTGAMLLALRAFQARAPGVPALWSAMAVMLLTKLAQNQARLWWLERARSPHEKEGGDSTSVETGRGASGLRGLRALDPDGPVACAESR